MNTCKEFSLDDVLAVTVIPLANITPASPSSVVNTLAATVPSAVFSPTVPDPSDPTRQVPNTAVYGGAVTIGLAPVLAGGTLIPVIRTTGKAKDDEGDSTPGRLHTVSVSCEVDDRDSTVWDSLLAIERMPGHLLLAFRGGSRAFVSATADTYLCNVERDGAKTSVAFRIQNLMGVQLLV